MTCPEPGDKMDRWERPPTWEHRWEHDALILDTPGTPDPHNHAEPA
jgi:hypothetical protein